MRRAADAGRISSFLATLGRQAPLDVDAYLTGGATAVLIGWRASTIDVDVWFDPDDDRLLRLLPALKEELEINIELASPADFIPPLPGWRDRRISVDRYGRVTAYHYDPYAQALSKIERGHEQDRIDVAELVGRGLVEPERALDLFAAIEPDLFRYPAIDPPTFRRKVEAAFGRRL